VAGAVTALAHDVITTKLTWSAEISRIVFRRCVSCHKPGGNTPMSLLTYEEARPWAKAIRDEVLARRMPPWGAIKGFGDFRHDGSLTQDEMTRIAEWVEGGAPEGDRKYLPPVVPQIDSDPAPAGTRIRASSLAKETVILAIHPLADVSNAKVLAQRPDGSVEHLIWLHNYKASWNRVFVLQSSLALPAGTKIITQSEAAIELLVKSPARER